MCVVLEDVANVYICCQLCGWVVLLVLCVSADCELLFVDVEVGCVWHRLVVTGYWFVCVWLGGGVHCGSGDVCMCVRLRGYPLCLSS